MSSIRDQITISAPIRKVWRALTTDEGVTSWWADEARLDARKGGRIVLNHGSGDDAVEERGIFHTVRPTSHVEIAWDSVGSSLTKGTRVRFQLGRDDNEVKVHLVHSGAGGVLEDEEAREALSELWSERLHKLGIARGVRGRTFAVGLAGLAIAAAYVVHAVQHGPWQVDDAGITFAYARHIAEGHGPVTNPGDLQPNEGYSNPAWTAILALTMLVGAFELVWTPKVLSVLATLATFGVLVWLVRRFEDGPVGIAVVLPAALLTANGSYVVWSVGGLENAQYVLTILAAMALYLRDIGRPEQWPRSGPVFFLVAISRPEGIVYTVAAGGDALVRAVWTGRWRWLGRLVAGLAVPLGVYVAWHLWVFGDLLPNTYYAKSRDASLLARLVDPRSNGWHYLLDGMGRWGQAPLWLLAVVPAIDREAWARGLGALWLGLLASVAFVLQANGDWMMQFRFMSPTFALTALLASLGVGVLGRLVVRGAAGPVVAGLVGLGAVASVGWGLPGELEEMTRKPTVPLLDRLTRLPRLLEVADGLSVEQPVILMSDMGGPMWINDARQAVLLDMFGLCDREIALGLHERDVDRLWDYAFSQHDPEFMQFPSTLYDRWRLDACVPFADRYMHLDDHTRTDDRSGFWLRRDLVEPRWDPTWATGSVVVQRPVRVHAVDLLDQDGRTATVEVVFSLMTSARVVPRVRLLLVGRRRADRVVELLPALRPTALVPDRVYRARVEVALPDDLGTLTEVTPLGTPEPSTLSPPPAWETVAMGSDVTGGAWTVGRPEDVSVSDGVIRYAPQEVAGNRLCLPSVLWSDALRIAGRIGVPAVTGSVDLDLRWFDAEGTFLGRERAWRWSAPTEVARDTALALDVPREAYRARVCVVAVDGPAVVTLQDLRWLRRDE